MTSKFNGPPEGVLSDWTARARGTSGHLSPGDFVVVDWNLDGRLSLHQITGRQNRSRSQSGVAFQIDPPVGRNPHALRDAWIDSDWFAPVLVNALPKTDPR